MRATEERGLRWRLVLLACVLGGLLALCIQPGSRATLLSDFNPRLHDLRWAGTLPDPRDPVTTTLWLERAAGPNHKPDKDELLLLYEFSDAASRAEPDNGFWYRSEAWCHLKMGNQDQAKLAWEKAKKCSVNNDHIDEALDFHLAHLPPGPVAWKRAQLEQSWPFTLRDQYVAKTLVSPLNDKKRGANQSMAAVFAASLPGAMLAVSAGLALVGGLSWALLKLGFLPRIADGWPVFVTGAVAGLVILYFTRLTATSLWASLLVSCFGVFRDRIIHHSQRSKKDDWVHFSLLTLASALVTVGLVAIAGPAEQLAQVNHRVDVLFDAAASLIQGGVLLGTVSIGVSLVRAYVARVEPVVEALGNLQAVALRLAVVCAVLTLVATPVCMAWDRALLDGMTQSRTGAPR